MKLSKIQLSPLIEEEGFAADFFDIYVKPNIRILTHQRSNKQNESTPVTLHDIFNCKPSQNIYISSPAGCGKTAFAKYLALIWCQAHLPVKYNNNYNNNSFIEDSNNSIEQVNSSLEENNSFVEDDHSIIEEDNSCSQEDNTSIEKDIMEMQTFMFLFFVFLRDEHEQECDVDIMIQNQLLRNLANRATYLELDLKFLQNLLSNEKCIIILDGLDEWSHPSAKECKGKNKHIPHSSARQFCTTLTTSRPWKLDVARLKPEDIDQKLELNGLEGDLLERLIGKVVARMNRLHGKDMNAYFFELKLRDKKLISLSKIPIVVMQLLTVWFDNETLGASQCEIYSNMIEFLLKWYFKKREIVSVMEDFEVDDCSSDIQTPKCLQKNVHCKVHMKILSMLAELAYNTLFTDNEESSLVFDKRIAKKYLTDSEIEMSLAVGILTQEKVIDKDLKRQSRISFIHKTFQEYLAALHVALIPGMVQNVEEKIKSACCSIEKSLEMSQIFMFLSGLCPGVMVNLHEHLRQTMSEDKIAKKYRASCKLDSESNEGKTLRRVQNTMVEWLGECWLNGHNHVTHLPVRDFFIWSPSLWSAVLRSLTVHNPVCSLYVWGVYSVMEIEDILNSVTVFTSIQKLWLYKVSETFVYQLVSQHKHSLRLRPVIWRHLEYVTFEAVTMSGDILCSMVDSIVHYILPKSVKVIMMACDIRQGNKDWKSYIQSHPRITVDDIYMNFIFLQFHTNRV